MNWRYVVQADWGKQAAVWVATSDDVPGLVTESESLAGPRANLSIMVPELLEANGHMPSDGHVAIDCFLTRDRRWGSASARYRAVPFMVSAALKSQLNG